MNRNRRMHTYAFFIGAVVGYVVALVLIYALSQ